VLNATSVPSPCKATPNAPESSLVGVGVRTDILLLSTSSFAQRVLFSAPARTSTPTTFLALALYSTRLLFPDTSIPAHEQS
jgi:hypothetical protein